MSSFGATREKELTVSQAASPLSIHAVLLILQAGSLPPTVLLKTFDESGLRTCVFKGNLVS